MQTNLFLAFLNSLKNDRNSSLIESIEKGFVTLNEGFDDIRLGRTPPAVPDVGTLTINNDDINLDERGDEVSGQIGFIWDLPKEFDAEDIDDEEMYLVFDVDGTRTITDESFDYEYGGRAGVQHEEGLELDFDATLNDEGKYFVTQLVNHFYPDVDPALVIKKLENQVYGDVEEVLANLD